MNFRPQHQCNELSASARKALIRDKCVKQAFFVGLLRQGISPCLPTSLLVSCDGVQFYFKLSVSQNFEVRE